MGTKSKLADIRKVSLFKIHPAISTCDIETLVTYYFRPLNRPGFDALNMSAPVMVQLNPKGKWESAKPENLEEQKLQAVVQHLINSEAISAAQSFCNQCALDEKRAGGSSQYIPVILMPINSADECPFDMDCEIQKMNKAEKEKPIKAGKSKGDPKKDAATEEVKKKQKKRGFVMQRLTDFDLLSQW